MRSQGFLCEAREGSGTMTLGAGDRLGAWKGW
jgi:hypothetical protein